MTQPLTRKEIENWRDLLLCGSTFFTPSGIAEVNALCDLALAGLEAREREKEGRTIRAQMDAALARAASWAPRDTDPGREEPMGEFAQVIHDNILDLHEKGIINEAPRDTEREVHPYLGEPYTPRDTDPGRKESELDYDARQPGGPLSRVAPSPVAPASELVTDLSEWADSLKRGVEDSPGGRTLRKAAAELTRLQAELDASFKREDTANALINSLLPVDKKASYDFVTGRFHDRRS
jgi:hypothetical protein